VAGKNSPSPPGAPSGRPVSLKQLAASLGLSPTTVSLVLNASPQAASIPPATQKRIFDAARHANYRPNFLARSLRAQRTRTVGVIVSELSEGYSALVIAGIEEELMRLGYICLATSHRHDARRMESIPRLLIERSVDGLILVDAPYSLHAPIPVVAVSGHQHEPGRTNIVLDHQAAATLGLDHLLALGHRHIAVIQGQEFSSDTQVRFEAIREVARLRGVPLDEALVVQLQGDSPSPETGYAAARELLARRRPFSALFAFNDISAFGAIRAFQEQGLSVPGSVSVVGFDDIWGAAYHIPALTTIRQPLRRMGALAAQTVVTRIESPTGDAPPELQVAPEFILRESTAPAP